MKDELHSWCCVTRSHVIHDSFAHKSRGEKLIVTSIFAQA
jgi:hypothetical protein